MCWCGPLRILAGFGNYRRIGAAITSCGTIAIAPRVTPIFAPFGPAAIPPPLTAGMAPCAPVFPMPLVPIAPAMAVSEPIINVKGIARIIETIIPAIGAITVIIEDIAIAIAVARDIAGIFAIGIEIAVFVIAFSRIEFASIAIAIIAGAIAIIDGAGRQAGCCDRQQGDVPDPCEIHNYPSRPSCRATQ